MSSLTIMAPRTEISAPVRYRSHNRRASDRSGGTDIRPSEGGFGISTSPQRAARQTQNAAAPADRSTPEPEGILLLVHDPTHERRDLTSLENAAHLAGLQMIEARNQEEALKILREGESRVDLLFALPQSPSSSPAAALIRKALELRPDLRVLALAGSGGREEIRAAYEAGAFSVILSGLPVEWISAFLRQSFTAAREARRRNLRRRSRNARHALESSVRRILRVIQSWANPPRGSRWAICCGVVLAGAIAILIGISCAFGLERFYRSRDRDEAVTERLLERLDPSRSPGDRENAALHRWQAFQQIGLSREANDVTRRYYEDHLQEMRRQYKTRRLTSDEPGSQDGIPSEDHPVDGAYRRTTSSAMR
jgi:DNA-binding NarL/FixJ family response regulator